MPTAPFGFVRSLEAIDPLLSVRWSDISHSWIIERQGCIREEEMKYLLRRKNRLDQIIYSSTSQIEKKVLDTYIGVTEELNSAKTGKRVILFAKELTPQIFNALCLGDIKRYGGYSRYADELEAKELADEKERQRIESNHTNAVNKEVYDMLNFIWRKKEDALLNGERNMRKLLHGEDKNQKLIG